MPFSQTQRQIEVVPEAYDSPSNPSSGNRNTLSAPLLSVAPCERVGKKPFPLPSLPPANTQHEGSGIFTGTYKKAGKLAIFSLEWSLAFSLARNEQAQ